MQTRFFRFKRTSSAVGHARCTVLAVRGTRGEMPRLVLDLSAGLGGCGWKVKIGVVSYCQIGFILGRVRACRKRVIFET
jgi:hypothetical protein